MNTLSRQIIDNYKIRHTKKQKADFREFMVNTLIEQGENVSIQSGKSSFAPVHNIIIGDLNTAQYLITAHYDTPNTSYFPVVMFADSFLLSLLGQIITFVPIFVLGILAAVKFDNPALSTLIIYAGLILGMLTFTNKNNYNDNTSGVVSVLEIFYALPKEVRDKGAFVLFDNEEKGLLGSLFLQKKLKNKKIPVYNFDCVGDGDEIRLFAKKNMAEKANRIKDLAELNDNKSVKVTKRSLKNMLYMSDDNNFVNAICFASFKSSFLGKYVNKIHSNSDKNLDERNIEIIVKMMSKFLSVH